MQETFDGDAPRTVREAICAFTNDLPDRRRPGVIFVGVRDDGTPTGLEINDALLLKLAQEAKSRTARAVRSRTARRGSVSGAAMTVSIGRARYISPRWPAADCA